MTAALLQINPEIDAVPAPKTKARSKPKTKAVATPKTNWIPSLAKLRHALTIGMGCMIPLWCSLLSHVGGTMLTEETTAAVCLGIGIMVICCTLLALSLSHLASAVADITKSGTWQSWAMAIAIDCSLVSCKLADAIGHRCVLVWAIILSVTVASMVLNCWAFLHHRD